NPNTIQKGVIPTMIPVLGATTPKVDFYPTIHSTRTGLLLHGGAIYAGFAAAQCDYPQGDGNATASDGTSHDAHCWIMAFDTKSFALLAAINTTPNSSLGGIWQSGNGLASNGEAPGVYAFTGNNGRSQLVDKKNGEDRNNLISTLEKPTEMHQSILRVTLNRKDARMDASHFKLPNWYRLDVGLRFPGDDLMTSKNVKVEGDTDLSSGGPVILDNGLVLGGGKEGRIYVTDSASMKGDQPKLK